MKDSELLISKILDRFDSCELGNNFLYHAKEISDARVASFIAEHLYNNIRRPGYNFVFDYYDGYPVFMFIYSSITS